ncbi:hypothetical protein [Yoonia litorea]|uniref:hypothetical protein n=1 Tax=Yoonia litorea TaxID=1123755 RepID=UPI0010424975|nr:hypothetical protein [Yoonia litorea]
MTHDNPFGASSYLTMGAVLVPSINLPKIRKDLELMRGKIDAKELHCTDLSHGQVAFCAREVKKLRMLAFGVISKKSTIGDYRKSIEGEKQAQDYYNKCAQYLFELVGAYVGKKELGA